MELQAALDGATVSAGMAGVDRLKAAHDEAVRTGVQGLLLGTIPNVLLGLTPWVAEPHTRAHGARSSQCTQCPCTVHRRDRRARTHQDCHLRATLLALESSWLCD